ncbi:LPD7 domain-containing protein (plasmid) [Brevundimonas staleyi]|uniref:LPD7 domain-containing protein n=1 Tax=Brevundimonas staleyi TaxID=74326 RepID=A0ABW0FNG6_9CAUL
MADDPDPITPTPEGRGADNTIEPGRARRRAKSEETERPVDPATTPEISTRVGDLPSAVAKRYQGEPAKLGGYIDYFEGPGSKHPAFRDRGGKLEALQTDPATVATLLAVAKHRNWTAIKVRGDDDFRREVWKEAQAMGLEVSGYRPKARDRAELDQLRTAGAERPQPPSAATHPSGRGDRVGKAPEVEPGVTAGKLIEIGQAPYPRGSDAKPTPFIRVEQADGRVKDLWGVGLPDALQRSGAQVGDDIRARRAGTDKVTVKVEQRDPESGRTTRRDREVDRNRWEIEADRFRSASPEQRMRDPAMAPAQSRLDVVESVARSRLSDPQAQARVVAGAEARIAEHIAAGRTIEPVRAPDRDRTEREAGGPERVRAR